MLHNSNHPTDAVLLQLNSASVGFQYVPKFLQGNRSPNKEEKQQVIFGLQTLTCWFVSFQTPQPEEDVNNKEASDLHEETDSTQASDASPPNNSDACDATEEGVTEHEAEQHGEEPQQQEQEARGRRQQTENEVSEVEIPNVGRIMVRADADGYNEEVSGECDDAQFYPKMKIKDEHVYTQ